MLKELPGEEFNGLLDHMNRVNSGSEDDDDDMSMDEFSQKFMG